MKPLYSVVFFAALAPWILVRAEIPPAIQSQLTSMADQYESAMKTYDTNFAALVKADRDAYLTVLAGAERQEKAAKRLDAVAAIEAEIKGVNAGSLPKEPPADLPVNVVPYRTRYTTSPERAAQAVEPVRRGTRDRYLTWLVGMGKIARTGKNAELEEVVVKEEQRVRAASEADGTSDEQETEEQRVRASKADGADDEQETIELTKDNPDTLIGTTTDNFTIYGLRLGMSEEKAWQFLRTFDSLIAEKDPQQPFVRVFRKGPGGVKSQEVLFTLSWESGPQLGQITLPDPCAEVLAPSFKRLYKEADAERPSAFVKKFLGPANSDKLDKKYQKSGIVLHISSYDAIGLTVQRMQTRTGNRISLKLTEATLTPTDATQVREWTDSTGRFQIRATLVKVAGGEVTLRKEDDKEIVVPLSRLSVKDRDFLKQRE